MQSKRQIERIRKRRAHEEQNLMSLLQSAYTASRTQGIRLLQQAGGLSVVEWRVLWDLVEAGPATIRDLSDIQRTDHSLLSRALPDMRRKGLIEMSRDAEDGRQMIVELTDTGRSAYELAAPVMKARRAALREHFSEQEIRVFVDLLDRFEMFLRSPVEEILNQEPAE